jgi:hypothetical protein
MRNEKYRFNTHTLQYERLTRSTKSKLFMFAGYLCAVLFSAVIIYTISSKFITTPKEKALQREMTQLEFHLENLNEDYQSLTTKIEDIQSKDAEVHRMIFGMEPIDESVWNGGVGGHEKYPFLANLNNTGALLGTALEKADKLKLKINLQQKSIEEIYNMASLREDKLASIPSIKPIREDKLKRKLRHLSGYGIRIHPVHKVKKFHKGIDFTAPRGTTIQATGDGKVIRVENKRLGYGRSVVIDHGFGYETLYAHMQSVDVKKGEKVKKGQAIGTVGSTGTSTAPHLHYEVKLNKKSVNPIDYCMDGLSPIEYEELIKLAEEHNQSFD